jgi:periplasmic protein TonB
MADYAPFQALPHRAVAAAGIIALHVLVAYLLATGLMHTILPAIEKPLLGTVIIETRPPPPPPHTPARLDLSHPRVTVAPPELPAPLIVQPATPQSPAGTEREAVSGVQGDSAAPPVRVLGKHQLPDAEEFYPPELRRLGVEGATYVRVCVDGAGVRQGDPRIEQSSGNTRLDEGAVNVARHGRYARSVQGDTPVPNCYHFRIVFRFK